MPIETGSPERRRRSVVILSPIAVIALGNGYSVPILWNLHVPGGLR